MQRLLLGSQRGWACCARGDLGSPLSQHLPESPSLCQMHPQRTRLPPAPRLPTGRSTSSRYQVHVGSDPLRSTTCPSARPCPSDGRPRCILGRHRALASVSVRSVRSLFSVFGALFDRTATTAETAPSPAFFSWWWGIKEKKNCAVGAVSSRGRAQVVTHVYTTSLQDIYSDYRRSYTCQLTCARIRCLPAALETIQKVKRRVQQAGVAAAGECSRAACRARRRRARAPLSDLGAWLPLRAARCSRTRPKAAAEARAARAARIYAYQSHCTIHARKFVTAARLASHTFVYRQNEPSLPTPTAEPRAAQGAQPRAAPRTQRPCVLVSDQRPVVKRRGGKAQQWAGASGEVAVARWPWRGGGGDVARQPAAVAPRR